MIKKSRVIDIEHDLAHKGERVAPVLITEDAHVTRDQTAKRIQREMTNRRFDTAPVQFLHDPCPRSSAKTFPRHVPTTADRRRDSEHDRKPQNGNCEALR